MSHEVFECSDLILVESHLAKLRLGKVGHFSDFVLAEINELR